MSYESMRRAVYTKEGKADFLKRFRYILCDLRLKHKMAFVFGNSYLSKGRIIPVQIKDVPLKFVIKNIRVLLRSYIVVLSNCMFLSLF